MSIIVDIIKKRDEYIAEHDMKPTQVDIGMHMLEKLGHELNQSDGDGYVINKDGQVEIGGLRLVLSQDIQELFVH